jgi:farnesyl-diphosphate farnesyltransferase
MNEKCARLLEETSRTFLIPIMRMPEQLQDAVGSAYLCLRAIDEIEDDSELPARTKIALLRSIADIFGGEHPDPASEELRALLSDHAAVLPEVTLSIGELAMLAPADIRASVCRVTAEMATAMADWVACDWRIADERDLDRYTFDVAGRVGLLLSEIWKWYDGTECDRELAVGFGRALQAVNIARNRGEDLARGTDFFPDGWTAAELIAYARGKIALADRYMQMLPRGVIHDFCAIPLALAKATLEALEQGREKLSRRDVESVVVELGLV